MTEQLTKAQERIKTALANYINLKHPVAMAVEPLRVDAIKSAKDAAKKRIEEVKADLEKHGWDRAKAAPYPHRDLWGHTRQIAANKYRLYRSVTEATASSHRMDDPEPCKISPKGVAKYTEDRMKDAGWDYDAFVVKLCKKIGDCKSATIEGEHIWGKSFLTVVKTLSDPVEIWMTQQITNCSVLGNYFLQWPSRKLKPKK